MSDELDCSNSRQFIIPKSTSQPNNQSEINFEPCCPSKPSDAPTEFCEGGTVSGEGIQPPNSKFIIPHGKCVETGGEEEDEEGPASVRLTCAGLHFCHFFLLRIFASKIMCIGYDKDLAWLETYPNSTDCSGPLTSSFVSSGQEVNDPGTPEVILDVCCPICPDIASGGFLTLFNENDGVFVTMDNEKCSNFVLDGTTDGNSSQFECEEPGNTGLLKVIAIFVFLVQFCIDGFSQHRFIRTRIAQGHLFLSPNTPMEHQSTISTCD